MTSLAIKSLWGRKVRAATTTLAVVIGVAFVAGSYILTDTIFAAFNQIFSDSLKGTAVVITAKNPVEQEGGEVPTIPASLLARVQRTPGVRLASGAIFTPGGFFNAKHEAIGSKFSPKFISSSLPDGLESLNYVAGHRPRGPSEASIDKAAAENAGISIGERFEIAGQRRVQSYRLVGLTRLGEASFGGDQHRPADPSRGAADHRQPRPLRPDLGGGRPRRFSERVEAANQAHHARFGQGRDGRRERQPGL